MSSDTRRDPMTRQRSAWRERDPLMVDGEQIAVFERNVHDGVLRALVAYEHPGHEPRWHISVSHSKPQGGPGRYPSWDELAHARYELGPSDVTFAMMLPPLDHYVADHPTTFHLFEVPWDG